MSTTAGEGFSVVLKQAGSQPLMTVKLLRQEAGLGLSEAKTMVDNAPSTVMSGLDRDKAVALKDQLEALGNIVSIPELNLETTVAPPKKRTSGSRKTSSSPKPPLPHDTDTKNEAQAPVIEKTTPSAQAPAIKATPIIENAAADIKTPQKPTVTPEEYKRKAAEAKARKDVDSAKKYYFEAAKYADIEALQAYMHLANPGFYTHIKKGWAKKTGAKLYKVSKKLYKLKEKLYGKRKYTKFTKKGLKLIEKSGCGDSPYADRLRGECYIDNTREHLHYNSLAADRGDYISLDYLLSYYAKDVSHIDSEVDTDKLWHYIFVLFETAELKLPWFTHKKLRYTYSQLSKGWVGDNYKVYAINRIAKALRGFIDDDVIPEEGKERVPVSEEMKCQIFSWLSYLVKNYEPYGAQDFGRYYLCYMLNEGYGCERNTEKATELVSGDIAVSKTIKAYRSTTIREYLTSIPMAEVPAYLVGCHNADSNPEYAKELLTFAVENGRLEKYKKAAMEKLADMGMTDNATDDTCDGKCVTASETVAPSASPTARDVKPAPEANIQRMEYSDGDHYEGEMLNGYRHGKGKYVWGSGAEYEGDWVNGKRTGYGIYRSLSKKDYDGSIYAEYSYEGEWKDSKKHGHGVWKYSKEYANGTIRVYQSYDGEWYNDKKHGHGKFSVLEHVEEGEYIEGKEHGMFICYEADSVSGKKYISWYEHGEALVRLAPYDPSIKTVDDARRAKDEADRKQRREYEEKKAREAASSQTVTPSVNSNQSSPLIDRWYNIMTKDFTGAVGGDAERFFDRYMSRMLSDLSGISGSYSWNGNGFSPELDEILTALIGKNMTRQINNYFSDAFSFKDSEEGPIYVVYKVAFDLDEVSDEYWKACDLKRSILSTRLARMLAYISVFHIGVHCLVQFTTDDYTGGYKALVNTYFCTGARDPEALTQLYYQRWMMNEDPHIPITDGDSLLCRSEWANGELLDAILEQDTLYFDGWYLDMSELTEYSVDGFGKVKYYGGAHPYD